MKKILVLVSCVFLMVLVDSCGVGGGDGGGGGGLTTTDPASITAIFTTATPNPTDWEGFTPNEWEGILCPPDLIQLLNHDPNRTEAPTDNLWIVNNCADVTVTLGICVFKGSLPQPEGGFKQCAIDPLDTYWSDLTFVAVTPGEYGVWYPTTGNLSVMVYWCSDAQELSAPPFLEKVSCILP